SYRILGNRAGQAYAAYNIGWCHNRLGNYEKGLAYGQEALDILLEIEDLDGSAYSWGSLGALHFAAGDQAQSEHCYQQAIAAYQRLSDRSREADIYVKLGDCYHQAGKPSAAHRAWQQALTVLGDLEPGTAAQIRTRLDVIDTSRSDNGHYPA